MKKIFFMAFIAFAMNVNAQESNNEEVVDDIIQVDYENEDEDDNWTTHVYAGVNIPTNVSDGLDFAPFRSWEFGITIVEYNYSPNDKKTTLSAGVGIGWRFYTLSGHDDMFVKDGDQIKVIKREGEMSDLSSNIHTFNFNVPLLVKQRFAKNFAISLGAQTNWNFYARANQSFEIGDYSYDIDAKKIGQRPFTVDVLGILHFAKDFGVYFRYSPMTVLKADRGPEFKSFTVGLYL